MKPPFDLTKLRVSLPLQLQIGHLSEAEREAMAPLVVNQNGLSEDALGQQCFSQALHARQDWIAANCEHLHWIDPVRDTHLRLIGRRFRFADKDEAFAFRMRFG